MAAIGSGDACSGGQAAAAVGNGVMRPWDIFSWVHNSRVSVQTAHVGAHSETMGPWYSQPEEGEKEMGGRAAWSQAGNQSSRTDRCLWGGGGAGSGEKQRGRRGRALASNPTSTSQPLWEASPLRGKKVRQGKARAVRAASEQWRQDRTQACPSPGFVLLLTPACL